MPADAEVDAFVAAVRDAGVQLVGLNFFAGDLAGPDCGVLSIPGRAQQFRDNIDVAVGIGEQLGVPAFNALYGNRVDGRGRRASRTSSPVSSCVWPPTPRPAIGATVLVEPVSGPKPYPLRTAADAVAVVRRGARRRGTPTSASCATCSTSPTTATTSRRRSRRTPTWSRTCRSPTAPAAANPAPASSTSTGCSATSPTRGYDGWVGLEYKPTTDTEASLAWLPTARRAVPAREQIR